MKEYFRYELVFTKGSATSHFEEFFTPQAGVFTFEEAREICFKRAFHLVSLKGCDIQDFKFFISNELELKKWEKKRVADRAQKVQLEKSVLNTLEQGTSKD